MSRGAFGVGRIIAAIAFWVAVFVGLGVEINSHDFWFIAMPCAVLFDVLATIAYFGRES